MKTTHFKYIEWRDTSGLHQDTIKSIKDLEFLKDELQFLKDLVTEHTLELIYGKSSEESRAIAITLTQYEERILTLLKQLKSHKNNLQFLMDDDDEPDELKSYKDAHYMLLINEMDLHTDIKKTKRMIFKMLSKIMKQSKQKRQLKS